MSSGVSDRVSGNVMLVGSLPYESVEQAMRAAAEGLRGHVFMLPDGEVGERLNWVGFLRSDVFSNHPQLEESGRPDGALIEHLHTVTPEEAAQRSASWTFRVKPGEDLRFDDLRYGDAAIESYRVFDRLRQEGVIEPHVRFQVGFPSPDSAINAFFVDPSQWPQVHRAYAAALGREIEKILTVIPAESLAIQYELVWEVVDVSMGTQNYVPYWPQLSVEEKFERHTELFPELARIVPEEVLLGYHWCYGTLGGWPMSAMEDLKLCVQLANAAVQAANRRVDFVHMPVVKDPDEAFFAPLADLDVGDAKVFLGIIHHMDGVEGFRDRLALAQRYLQDFGIAGVCGYGRVDPAELPTVLRVHRECAALLDGVNA